MAPLLLLLLHHHHHHRPLLPSPPHLLPNLLPYNKDIHRFFSHLAHCHSLLSHAVHEFKHSLGCTLRHAVATNAFLLKLLPPQLYPRNYLQVRGQLTRDHHLLSSYGFAAVLPGDSVVAAVVSNGIFNFLNIYNTLLIVRLILTWFPDPPQVIVNPLSTLCDPYLNIFRGIIPPLGGTLDFSPILAFLVLNVFTNTAAALPAELPPSMGTGHAPSVSARQILCAAKLTWAQKAWLKRHATCQEAQEKESCSSKDDEE